MRDDIEKMLADIRREIQLTRDMIGHDHFDERVMAALAKVPRDRFVGPDMQRYAFDNGPLPIGSGQTISQPYIVALMTDLAEIDAGSRVLEVGTGSGYQAAILAELAAEVYSTEIIPVLAENAAQLLRSLGYRNLHTRTADGYYGWPEEAPFDAILVTAAAPKVPPPLLEQLKPQGRLVIPVAAGLGQELQVWIRGSSGKADVRKILPVMFVPLTGKH